MFRLTEALVGHLKVMNQILVAFACPDRNLDDLVEVRRILGGDVGVYNEPSEHVEVPITVVDTHQGIFDTEAI